MGEFSFAKKDRLLEAGDFKRVFDGADHRASHKHLLMLAVTNELGHDRLGLVIAKKHVRHAVQRNRIKRLLRESFRTRQIQDEGMDIVVLARKGIDQLDNATLSSIVREQWQQLTGKQT